MNLVAPIRVVVVDDKPTHLFSIVNGLTLAGIPCVWHLYDVKEHRLIPEPPSGGYPYLRTLVTDLNIREMVDADRDPKNLAGTLISEVLQPLVSTNGGPYAVVLWTSVNAHAEEVGPIIKERINAEQLRTEDRRPAPLSITPLPKGPFLSPAGNDETEKVLSQMFRETAKKADEFKKAVERAVSADPGLRLASAWESRVGLSASSTLRSIHSVAVDEASGVSRTPSEGLIALLAKITIDAVGAHNAIEDTAGGLDAGLIDLLNDQLGVSSRNKDYGVVVQDALAQAIAERPRLSEAARNCLNTHLHVEVSPDPREVVTRGAVFEAGDDELRVLCGQDVRSLLKSEFFADFNPSPELIEKSHLRLIEIGADCDHAQRKPRTIRLLAAAQIPRDPLLACLTRKQKDDLERTLEGKHGTRTMLGPWTIESKADDPLAANPAASNDCFVLVVSLRRFVSVQEWSCPDGLKMIYRVRKPIADSLLYKYSAYSHRPGIVTISE